MLPYPTIAYVLQIGTYSALIGDQALFCSSKISKALPSVFSSSALHSPLPSAHYDVHVYWGLLGVLRPRLAHSIRCLQHAACCQILSKLGPDSAA